jgi:aarF domain-containing kinase
MIESFRFLRCYDRIFPFPVFFLANFIASRLRLELDFENEAENAKRTESYLESFSSSSLLSTHSALATLGKRVYVPKVYDEYTTKHVMTAEWINGVRMSDRNGLERLVSGSISTNSQHSTRDTFIGDSSSLTLKYNYATVEEKRGEINGKNWDGAGISDAQSYWRDNNIPIKGGKKAIMQSMIDLFCAQMFVFGFIRKNYFIKDLSTRCTKMFTRL